MKRLIGRSVLHLDVLLLKLFLDPKGLEEFESEIDICCHVLLLGAAYLGEETLAGAHSLT